ncbi:MAG: ZIP family metal transporter [Anaerovoracaceae bacterium]
MSTLFWISLFALGAMVVNGIGIYSIYKNRDFAEKNKTYFICFAAGVLIAAPLIHTLPHAFEKNSNAGAFALVGFLFMFFSNKIIKLKTNEKELAFGITAIEGIGIHSFIDGIIYTVTFSASTMTGVLAGIGLVAHEFAEGVIVFSVLLKSGLSAKKAAFYGFLVAGLTTPLGAFIVYPLIHKLAQSYLGLALGFVAGVLIYISASHLLPEAREHEKHHSHAAFLLGVLLAIALAFVE